MKRVTRDVEVADVADLLDGRHRGCVAFVTGVGPQVLPVVVTCEGARYVAAVDESHGPLPDEGAEVVLPDEGAEVVLLADDGVRWFELRAVYVRGRAGAGGGPANRDAGRRVIAVEPAKIVAWDYGTLREADDEA